MRADFLHARLRSLLFYHTLVVGPLEGDLAYQAQDLFGAVAHQLLLMPAAPHSLPRCLLLWGGLTEDALHPSASDLKDRFHHLLLQSLEISLFESWQMFQQLEHSSFCFLHQCSFQSFFRFHVQGSPHCCSPWLVLQLRVLLFGSFAYNFFIHPSLTSGVLGPTTVSSTCLLPSMPNVRTFRMVTVCCW